jgi:hypothetical protein
MIMENTRDGTKIQKTRTIALALTLAKGIRINIGFK